MHIILSPNKREEFPPMEGDWKIVPYHGYNSDSRGVGSKSHRIMAQTRVECIAAVEYAEMFTGGN